MQRLLPIVVLCLANTALRGTAADALPLKAFCTAELARYYNGSSFDDCEGSGSDATPARRAAPKPKITISKETTHITAPLRPDGYVDYPAAINEHYSRGVTSRNNAAVLLWQAFGPAPIKKGHREQFFKMLGIPPLPEKGEYFVSLDEYVKQLQEGEKENDDEERRSRFQASWKQLDEACTRPWSQNEFPIIAGWLRINEKPLALIATATQRTRFHSPLVGSMFSEMFTQPRYAIQLMRARAMLRLHGGQIVEAWQDLMTCYHLARLVSQGPTLIDIMLGIILERTAGEGLAAFVGHAPLTSLQAGCFRADLQRLPARSSLADCLDVGERFVFLDNVAEFARLGASQIRNQEPFERRGSRFRARLTEFAADILVDWNEPLRMGNRWYDGLVKAWREPKRTDRMAALAKLNQELEAIVKRDEDVSANVKLLLAAGLQQAMSRKMGVRLVALAVPAVVTVGRARDRGDVHFTLVRLALGLAAYRADHGTYPKNLAALSPKYITELPKDLFTEGDFQYQLRPDGYLLYSVGPNRKDDGGRSHVDAKSNDELE